MYNKYRNGNESIPFDDRPIFVGFMLTPFKKEKNNVVKKEKKPG